MNKFAVRADGLGKKYRRGVEEHGSLIEQLRLGKGGEPFWALRNVSFEVAEGEALGFVGHNGAGKSTLLKILSRITRPSEGAADIYGRVGSLLEVGTGFHGELTGRENVYLNGAILGMTRTEVSRKFDEIVDFAGVEEFIDTPVKRYSSGMGVRLAFAVAAHLEPEVILVDEVLAVGDAAFQKKCLGKMTDIAQEGRTVLFVSHNMVALQSLCQRAIWIDKGQIREDGNAVDVISNYLQSSSSALTEQVWEDVETAPGNDYVRLYRTQVRPESGSPADPITMETPIAIETQFWNLEPDAELAITFHVYTEQQIVAFTTGSFSRQFPKGLCRTICHIPGHLLNSGQHRILLLVIKDGSSILYRYDDALSFDVLDLDNRADGWYGKEPGVVQPMLNWDVEYLGNIPGSK